MVYYRYFEYGEDGNPIQKNFNPKDSKSGRLHFVHSIVRKITIRCRPNGSIDEDRPTHDPVQETENRGASQQSEETVARDFFEYIAYYSHVEPVESSNPPRFEKKGIFCESFYSPIHDIAQPEDNDLLRLLNEAWTERNSTGANQAACRLTRNPLSGCRYSAYGGTERTAPLPGYWCQSSNPIAVPTVPLGTGALHGLDARRNPRNTNAYPGRNSEGPLSYAGNTDRLRGNGRQGPPQSDFPLQNYAFRRQYPFLGHQTQSRTRHNSRPSSQGLVNPHHWDYGVFIPAYLPGLLDASYPVIPDDVYAEYCAALQQYDRYGVFF